MGKNNSKKSSESQRVPMFLVVLLAWIPCGTWAYFNFPKAVLSLPAVFSNNILVFFWNALVLLFATYASMRLIVFPVWRVVFKETNKVGQKLEWHSFRFKHLDPESKILFRQRLIWTLVISFVVSLLIFLPDRSLFRLQSLTAKDPATLYLKAFTDSYVFSVAHWAIMALIVCYFAMVLEGRSRILLRVLTRVTKRRKESIHLKKLPESLFDPDSPTLDLSFYTAFTKVPSTSSNLADLELSIERTPYESQIKIPQKGAFTSALGIGPAGSGKTQCMVIPVLEQAISWQADDDTLKASIIVYDPKAELTDIAVRIAKDNDRESDLILLSLDGESTVNPIHIDTPWTGEASYKVAGWVVGAWQNFQGKESPEPYWATQNYLLTRNLLVIDYLFNEGYSTLTSLAKSINNAGSGCFRRKSGEPSVITSMGEEVLVAQAALDKDEYLLKYLHLEFESVEDLNYTEELRVRASERLRKKIAQFTKRIECQERTKLESESTGFELDKLNSSESDKKVKEAVNKALVKKFGENLEVSEHHIKHEVLIRKSEKHRDYLENLQGPKEVKEIVASAVSWLLKSWSENDNRGSIISNMLPFLQQFDTPEIKRVLSPERNEENESFEKLVATGKIVVPDFPDSRVGEGIANAIVTIVKSRWQYAVLSQPKNKRIKVQVMDEAQRVISFGDGKQNKGDLDFAELSRSFCAINWYFSQSIAALKAKAARDVDWEKMHGVIRSIYIFATNDPSTLKLLQEISGKEVKKRLSKTVTETSNTPQMDALSEKYSNTSGSLGISYSESEVLEDKIQAKDLQEGEAFTAIASIYDGSRSYLTKLAIRPAFWPEERDSYELISRCDFNPEKRETLTRRQLAKL